MKKIPYISILILRHNRPSRFSTRGTNLALRWITRYAKERSGKNMALKLANELIDASNESGSSSEF